MSSAEHVNQCGVASLSSSSSCSDDTNVRLLDDACQTEDAFVQIIRGVILYIITSDLIDEEMKPSLSPRPCNNVPQIFLICWFANAHVWTRVADPSLKIQNRWVSDNEILRPVSNQYGTGFVLCFLSCLGCNFIFDAKTTLFPWILRSNPQCASLPAIPSHNPFYTNCVAFRELAWSFLLNFIPF